MNLVTVSLREYLVETYSLLKGQRMIHMAVKDKRKLLGRIRIPFDLSKKKEEKNDYFFPQIYDLYLSSCVRRTLMYQLNYDRTFQNHNY